MFDCQCWCKVSRTGLSAAVEISPFNLSFSFFLRFSDAVLNKVLVLYTKTKQIIY